MPYHPIEAWAPRKVTGRLKAVGLYAVTSWLDWARLPCPAWLRWLGAMVTCAGLGFLMLSSNWLVGAVYLGTLCLMYGARVSAEEEMMAGRFGDAYRHYMQRTGRLLPWPWGRKGS